MSILVAGIGNIFQGDDAFGCEVARELTKRVLPDHVRVVDFGIRGIDLTYALCDRPELTILLDAVSRGGQPGTLYTIEPALNNLEDTAESALDPHTMNPMRVLQMAESFGGPLGRVLLVGCEPADLGGADGRMGLTLSVRTAVGAAADIVESIIEKEQQEIQHET